MTYKIVIDRSLCSGFGTCAEMAPHLFDVAADGIAATRVGETDDEGVLDAAASCPMGAISVFHVATGEQAA
jgi:ferredoxin